MRNERKQVLELLAQGKITAEEAERLLDRLASSATSTQMPGSPRSDRPKMPQFMRVQVMSNEGDQVNVRLPIGLIKSGIKLTAMMPRDAAEAMANSGLDLSHLSALSGDDLMAALQAMEIDVDSHEGHKVKVYCE